ncbi:hypothetical protein K437DRAFT_265258 [Tilletiaria anomala UBC 951]|uniref:MmgE/PrpD N-terminal domain-containing protein n=1 Tax=Tilletiaria anomala (strain ATCC 24038 / CBS 436.72 / UBC 951) TaxID=1037660 RepID=A0A066VDB7_TILAU|nr:uncharacterized protein K437DRAFT_265258 [Tilletiaria anomala UBC 951]KDN36590.1 hypothetical protein K437DRAFT_265258 [Tilletiaria anomala UBC 951]
MPRQGNGRHRGVVPRQTLFSFRQRWHASGTHFLKGSRGQRHPLAISSVKGSLHQSAAAAAWINAAGRSLLEQDHLHNSRSSHWAGKDLIVASIAGYEAGCQIGEYLRRSHYRYFHMPATVGTLAAAIAVGAWLGINTRDKVACLFGNARQWPQVCGNSGLRAPTPSNYMQQKRLRMVCVHNILEGNMGTAAGMSARDEQQHQNYRPCSETGPKVAERTIEQPLDYDRDLVQVAYLL